MSVDDPTMAEVGVPVAPPLPFDRPASMIPAGFPLHPPPASGKEQKGV